jgi:hypothetical protein
VNWQHLRTFFWLRWRIRVNQLKRGGFGSTLVMGLLTVVAVTLAAAILAASFVIGMTALRTVSPTILLLVWGGVVLSFLFSWIAGVLSDLQRSEVLSLDKFLHLPVSLSGAFLVNYLGSLFSLTLLMFVPGMIGLTLGLAVSRGPAMLLLLPALAALLLMVTALSHQFQGWLASLMVNKRRRRTIITVLTMAFVLFAQVPNLINQWSFRPDDGPRAQALTNAQNQLYRQVTDGEITTPVYEQRLEKLRKAYADETEAIARRKWEQVERVTSTAGLFLPPAWLPLGAKSAAEGKIWPVLLATLGMTLLGSVSLWRSYRTTLRLYTGQFNAGSVRPATAPVISTARTQAAASQTLAPATLQLLERQLPWLNEQATAVALTSFRSLLRAPEIKMMLLSPVFMLVAMGPVMMRGNGLPEVGRPLMAFGAMSFVLLVLMGVMANQFGLDRSGFQVFMLCGAKRGDILLGKNMATAPFALGMALVFIAVMQIVVPMPWTYLAAVPAEMISMYLLFCLLANMMSIQTPINVPAGSLRRARPSGKAFVVQLSSIFILYPIIMLPTLVPLGAQMLLERQGWNRQIPVCLLLALVECVIVAYVYRLVLGWQGRWLQSREQAIYAIVRSKEE